MNEGGWHGHLNEASTQEGVVLVCNQFLMMWTPFEIEKLPASTRPKHAVKLQDVSPYALLLVMELAKPDHLGNGLLERMSTFFTKAAQRIAEIRAATRNDNSA
jgi:hypothetical protein